MKFKVYHGSGSLFEKFEQNKARIVNDFYGGGVAYFTDNLEVAEQYAAAMAKKTPTKEKFIYEVELDFKKLFDVDAEYSGPILKKFVSNPEGFARGAGMFKLGADKFGILADLKSGNITFNGEQVFKGLSGGMISTSKARETLKRLGYDGLRYNGGIVMHAKSHNVYLAYHANDIKILDIKIK